MPLPPVITHTPSGALRVSLPGAPGCASCLRLESEMYSASLDECPEHGPMLGIDLCGVEALVSARSPHRAWAQLMQDDPARFADDLGPAGRVEHVIDQPGVWMVSDPTDAPQAVRALDWALSGWANSLVMQQWVQGGFEHARAAWQWAKFGLGPQDAKEWGEVAADGEMVAAWRSYGMTPEKAAPFEHPAAYKFASLIDARDEMDAGQWGALWRVCTPDFARLGLAAWESPQGVEALAGALAAAGEPLRKAETAMRMSDTRGLGVLPWSMRFSDWAVGFASPVPHGRWADAATCLRAGMGREEMLAHLRSGADMEPVEVMAALNG